MSIKTSIKTFFSFQLLLIFPNYIFAREMRTPLDLRIGPIHYPVWNKERYESCCFDLDLWAGGYNRVASNGYDKHGWRCQVPLSTIQFNLPVFTMAQTFQNNTVSAYSQNPWISVSTINPNFTYKEKGIMAGLIIGTRPGACGNFRIGMRARIPYRVVDAQRVDSDSCCPLEGETLKDVRRLGNDLIPAIDPSTGAAEAEPLNGSFAYRFDFVSALLINYPNGTPEINFKNTDVLSHITAANNTVSPVVFEDITDAGVVNSTQPIEGNPVNFIVRDNGTAPEHPYAAFASTTYGAYPGQGVDQQPFLNGDGTGGVNNGRVRMSQNNDYTVLGNTTSAQARLWMVPTAYIDNTNVAHVGDTAQAIANTIEQIIPGIDPSILTFFYQNNLDFSSQNNKGVGDLDTEYYVAYDFDERFWGELNFGIIFPTARQIKEPKKIFLFALGNNGHMELRLGTQGGYDVFDWFKFDFDAYYSFVLNRTEPILASFMGASVKNLGPQVDAKIHWGYFWGHVNFTFLEPCSKYVGFNLGYELYAKQRDKICFCRSTMPDYLGNYATLNPYLAAERTNVTAQKVRVEVFSDTRLFDIYGGWSKVFAGKNAMDEIEWYLGFGLKF